ncbi:hypothetical protein JCM11641_007511 [Rhodosporidiobolus odoratus]
MLRSRYPVLPFLLAALAILAIAFVTLRDSFDSPAVHNALWAPGSVGRGGAAGAPGVGVLAEQRLLAGDNGAVAGINVGGVAARVAHGGVIMPKLPNATAKAELGQASWKLLHTMAARFPEEPTDDEREAFKSYLHLFSRLYPCGECAAEFQALLRQLPPQTSSRSSASMWLCSIHNLVNERLGKPEFDCSADLEGVYDCGCGDLGKDELDVGEKGKVGTDKGAAGANPKAKVRKEVQLNMQEDQKEQDGKRDPQTGLELVGG